MTEVPLLTGGVALVDDVDRKRVLARRWRAASNGRRLYVRMAVGGRPVYLHRFILGVPTGIDHINGDPFDNRRANLRPASPSQNAANMAIRGGTSRFKGVYTRGRSWFAQIGGGRAKRYLGSFETETEAAAAYNAAASATYGEYARLNPIGDCGHGCLGPCNRPDPLQLRATGR